MRGPAFACSLLLALIVAALPASAQTSALPKVPRRVYFEPAVVAAGISDPALRRIPDYLYTQISAHQPIVRVDSAQKADSVIEVTVSQPGPSVVVKLLAGGSEAAKVSFLAANYDTLARFVDKAARQLAPQLGPVEPKVERITAQPAAQSKENEALFKQVRAAERLARPIEYSLDGLGLIRLTDGQQGSNPSFVFDALPLILQFTYFPSRSVGLIGSLWTYYGNALAFGETQTSSGTATTRTLLLLPGVGIKYRSLGTVFASFSAIFYAGYGYVTNTNAQAIGYFLNQQFQPFLNPGASASIFYMTLRFASEIGYNFTPHFAAHTGVVMNLSPNVFSDHGFLGYPSRGNSFFLQYLTLGISYRP